MSPSACHCRCLPLLRHQHIIAGPAQHAFMSLSARTVYRLSPCPHLVHLAAASHRGCHGSRAPECRPGTVRQRQALLLRKALLLREALLLLLLLLQTCIEPRQLQHMEATSEF